VSDITLVDPAEFGVTVPDDMITVCEPAVRDQLAWPQLPQNVHKENVAMRGIDYFLDQMASSLTAHAEHPVEVRDIAISLRSKAAALRRGTP
jgi:hypothetical protein